MAFVLTEKFDMTNASRINYDEVQDQYKDRIKNTLQRLTNGSIKVNYRQKMKGVGRYYATVANKNGGSCVPLQSMPSIVRNALTSSIYHDIDIVNCHPVLLEQVASKLKQPIPTPRLTYYNNNRKSVLDNLGDGSKNIIQRLVYGGTVEQWKNDFNYEGDIPEIFDYISKEVNEITLSLICENEGFIKKVKEIKGTQTIKPSSIVSYYLSTIEADIVKEIMNYFTANEWVIGAYIYDGLLVEKRDGLTLDFDSVEKHIFEKIGYRIKLSEKPIVIDPKIIKANDNDDDIYLKLKPDFEKTHFKVMNPFCFIRLLDDGGFQTLDEKKLFGAYRHIRVDEKRSIVDKWVQDGSIRTYEKIDLLPPPLIAPENVFNTWKGFPVEKFASGGGGDYTWFLKHLELCYAPDVFLYLLKWLAWVVQKPAELPGVCVVITGKQGSGKSIIFETLMAKMLGDYYGTTNNPSNDLFSKFAELKNGKRLIVINDCPVSQIKNGSESFKSLISDPEGRYEQKGCQMIRMRNIASYMMITNSDEPVRLESSDRRYMVAECKSDLIGNFDYFKDLAQKVQDESQVRAVYDFLMSYDISQVVNLAKERPITQVYKDNKMISADKELLFLASFIPSIKNTQMKTSFLYSQYKQWAINCGGISDEKFLRNSISFGIYMKKIPGVVWKSDPSNGSKVSFEKDILTQYLIKCEIDIDGVCVMTDMEEPDGSH